MKQDDVGFEIPQIRIFKLDVLVVAVVTRLVEGWLNSLRQEKQLQHALDFSRCRTAKDGNPSRDEIGLLEQFLFQRRALAQDICRNHRESQQFQYVGLQVSCLW